MAVATAWLRMFMLSVVVLSSVSALPIDLEEYNRRNDLGLSYREMRRVLEEVFQTGKKRMDPFAGKTTKDDDDYDLKHYEDEDLDYGLLERLTNELLIKNGGDLDRGLTDTEYEDISERYFKRLQEEHTSEKVNAWQTAPNTEYGSTKFGTTWATYTPPTKSSEDGNKTPPTDDGKATSHQGVHRPTTPGQSVVTTPVTPRDEWSTKTNFWNGQFWGFKTGWPIWEDYTTAGTDSFKDHSDHTKHFDWTGESKSGHKVHVVVYFEK